MSVSARPRVAIISTGDELVDVDRQPGRDQIRNSNSYTLYAQILQAGGQPEMLGIARDNVADLREKIGEGLKRDILLVSGGVSMGKYDLVEGIFDEFGVEVLFDKVAMKPGKPTVFGHRDKTFVFGLPGNPVSTMVSFELLSVLWSVCCCRPPIWRGLSSRRSSRRNSGVIRSGSDACPRRYDLKMGLIDCHGSSGKALPIW